mgnify:CR=1 FL=1
MVSKIEWPWRVVIRRKHELDNEREDSMSIKLEQNDSEQTVYDELSDQELLRYSRQIMLPKFDIAGQLALKNASVLNGLHGVVNDVGLTKKCTIH